MEGVSSNIKDYQLSVRIYILIITAPLIVLCLIKKLKYLAPFSLIADIFVGELCFSENDIIITCIGPILGLRLSTEITILPEKLGNSK